MKEVPLSKTYLSRETQKDLAHIRSVARDEERWGYHSDNLARAARAKDIQRTVARIARREAKP